MEKNNDKDFDTDLDDEDTGKYFVLIILAIMKFMNISYIQRTSSIS